MLKVSDEELERLDDQYPGLRETILKFEALEVPDCPNCQSGNTASVQIGIIGRTIALVAATSKVKLFPNRTFEEEWFCHECQKPFS